MFSGNSNLRKAAILIRTLDADSAAKLLSQLSPEEAALVREAIRFLGSIDGEEQADVAAELRRSKPLAKEPATRGVELELSKASEILPVIPIGQTYAPTQNERKFDFLEGAPTSVLVSRLSREHAQTIAVVLSHLAPAHAAQVLSALPENRKAETISRLATIGDTDAEVVSVLQTELAEWVAKRSSSRKATERCKDAIGAILAAADPSTQTTIRNHLKSHRIALPEDTRSTHTNETLPPRADTPIKTHRSLRARLVADSCRTTTQFTAPLRRLQHQVVSHPPAIHFDHLIHLDDRTLASVLHDVNADALTLALAGADDALVDRICTQMPKTTAKAFRRELRHLGPTRLSDVEAAQRLIADAVAKRLAERRNEQLKN